MLLAGCFGVLYLTFMLVRMHHAQAAARTLAEQLNSGVRASEERPVPETLAEGSLPYGSPASRSATGNIIGNLQIPQLALTAPLIDGISTSDLQRGAGHIPGTALPGGLGTVGIAAHRDTYFRPLRQIAPGMKILATGPKGTFEYEVLSASVVSPAQVSVLDVADVPQMTLITCFPFNYVGSAPQRFVVRARLVSLEPRL